MVYCGTDYRVDVFSLNQLPVICISLDLIVGVFGNKVFGVVCAVSRNVTNRCLGDVVGLRILAHLTYVCAKTTSTNADIANYNLLIGTLYIGRRCLLGTVYGYLERRGRCRRRAGGL